MKKLFAVLLALVLTFGVFSALAEQEQKLTVWCWDPAFNLYAMEEAAKVYQQDHPDFVIDIVEVPWNDIQTRVITAAMAGDISTLPDIFLCQDNAFQKNVINYPELFMDITEGGVDFSQFAEAKTSYSVVDGRNYGVPFDNGAVVSAIRTDYLEEAGYTVDDLTDITWSRFIEIGKDILAKTGRPMLTGVAGEPDLIMMMLQSCGASLFNEDGSLNIKGNEDLKQVVETFTTLVSEGIYVEVVGWDNYVASLVNGNVTGTINGCWILASIQTAADQSGKWAVTNMPSLDGIDTATNYSNNGGSSWAVSANCQNYELANDFLAKTFGGSVEFYETILPASGALATYLPAGDSDVYGEPQEFFAGQPIYSDITAYAALIPSNAPGVYYYEARDAIAVAMSQVLSGADIDAALDEADMTVSFQMGI
ncbi:MAG: extracellular solute-binding protein [Clostridia bacterium]|nr:extracellular solute-binding protein [Clostridia bacterium]